MHHKTSAFDKRNGKKKKKKKKKKKFAFCY